MQASLSSQALRERVMEVGQATLPLEAAGYKCTTELVYDVLLKAAADGLSIEAACDELATGVDGNTVRRVLNAHLDPSQLRAHEGQLNQALSCHLPPQIWARALEAAIDVHDEPFYGKHAGLRAVTCRGKARQGTTHFVRIASLYVRYRQLRLTVALTFVLPEDTLLAVVPRLYERVRGLALRLQVLYLDKGFCHGAIIRYLQAQRQPAVLACAIRGQAGGTRALCRGRKSYRTRYTFGDGTTVEVAVVASLVPGPNGRRRRKWLLFVVLSLAWTARTVYRRYRRRFGIESTYRMGRQVRITTTSRNPALRFFFMGFALLLVTLWAGLRWVIARIPGRGPHRVQPDWFRFRRFLHLLRHAVELVRGVVQSVPLRPMSQMSIY